MSNKDRTKQTGSHQKQGQPAARRDQDQQDDYRSTDLHDSPMMAHLLETLDQGQDIGHYGRLTFVMIARHFMAEDELLARLKKQPGIDENEARAMILQVNERGYNPPKRERILDWQTRQDFQICPEADDPNGCNVYRDLQFPEEIYEQIDDFWEEKAEAKDD